MSRYVTMSQFLHHGRFANQLFNYAFLRCYCAEHGCVLQLPPWAGNELFDLYDPPLTIRLPAFYEQTNDGTHLSQAVPPSGDALVNHDWRGYAQFHTSFWRYRRHWWWALFRPRPSTIARYRIPQLDRDNTWIGLHLRYTDYGREIFYRTPVQWYLDWLEANFQRFDKPRLFFASDEPKLAAHFDEYSPLVATNLGVELSSKPMANVRYLNAELKSQQPHAMSFYPDFNLLSQCDVIVAGNSTFSFAAAMLNLGLREFWRSDLPSQSWKRIDPWDDFPLTHDKAEDYRHIPFVCLDSNPGFWDRLPNGKYKEEA